MTAQAEQLKNRDVYVIVDATGSMGFNKDTRSGASRWKAAEEGTCGLVQKLTEYDPDGLTLYRFAGNFERTDHVKDASSVIEMFKKDPTGSSTVLAPVLKNAFDDYFANKAAGKAKANGALVLVVTDGKVDDQDAVAKLIAETSGKIDKDEELGIQLLQIGQDEGARAFLKFLDDDLQTKFGAKHDIVDTTSQDEAESLGWEALLLKTLND